MKNVELDIRNLSNSDDTKIIEGALDLKFGTIDCKHSGAAIRFLAAHYASIEGTEITLTGSERLKERPIKELIEALISLGADIQYLEKEGFAPIAIKGRELVCNKVIELNANISSQFVSALLLISNRIKNGLKLRLMQEVISEPYINMTLKMLNDFGIDSRQIENEIIIDECLEASPKIKEYIIESDWSSASYWYSFVSLGLDEIKLKNYHKNSIQGDSKIADIMNALNVQTSFEQDGSIKLRRGGKFESSEEIIDFINYPDLAQTLICLFAFQKKNLKFKGVESLKIKESNRIEALQIELQKINARIIEHENYYELNSSDVEIPVSIFINTYHDHRMAMSFAPLMLLTKVSFDDENVVSKSYPNFFVHCNKIINS
ncbi:MAG: 3-phosphoshikimate 1-carboxyvinyltransferase [bacterium]